MPIKLIPTGTGFARLTEAVTTEFGALITLVRQALQDTLRRTPGLMDCYADIQGIWPDRIVARYAGRLWSYPYTLNADNTVTLGERTEVVASFEAVNEPPEPPEPGEPAGMTESARGVFREAADGSIEVTIVKAGRSVNGNFYSDQLLRESVAQFEGVRVFDKSDEEHQKGGGKAVKNLLGGIYGVRFVEGKSPDTGRLVGTFKPLDPKDGTVVKMTEAVKRGMTNLLGLSIDAVARTKKRMDGNQTLREATKFVRVLSVDLIVEPSAGGGLDRLTEATATDLDPIPTSKGSAMPLWKQRLLEAIKAKDATKFAAINPETIGDDELVKLHESVCGPLVPADSTQQRLTEAAQGDNAPVTRAELQMFTLRQTATAAINASKLPAPAKARLVAQFGTLERFTEAQVTQAIKDEGEYLAKFTESGAVRVPAFSGPEVGDRSVAIKDMLDAFFDPAHKHHGQVQSFRECYIEITGDRRVTGDWRNCDQSRLAESLGVVRESVTTAAWADALGDSLTRRLQAVYAGLTNLDAWQRVATWGPVNDFRSQQRVRIGGYGNLPAVSQSGSYNALTSPGDDVATYAVTKRGGTESVTLEAIRNDDVQAIRRIPTELALAAKNTLYEFVFDFFRTNPTVWDGVALYHATHGNLFTAALSAAEFSNHRLAMLKQTRSGSAKRLATGPATILVPYELEETAFNVFQRNQNLDKTFVQTQVPNIISVSYWTDTNDWVTVADPAILPVLEIGFLDGRMEPELFVQDMNNVGSMFSNDQLTYKIRHIYGGAALVDGEKGTTKAVVP